MAEVYVSCDPAFQSVRDPLQQKLAGGSEEGVSICVNIDGLNIVDIWGGHADANQTKPWTKDTITGVRSSTEIFTCLVAHMLVDRSLLDMGKKVANYWPEFGANGKENVKVSYFLSHSSGGSAWEGPITAVEMAENVDRKTRRAACLGNGRLAERISIKKPRSFGRQGCTTHLGNASNSIHRRRDCEALLERNNRREMLKF